jgi:hypothetical protein
MKQPRSSARDAQLSHRFCSSRTHKKIMPRHHSSVKKRVLMCAVVAVALRVGVAPFYYSTDFEVHRNWLAITHSLPVEQWYRDATSPWTLDYPPLFAWFEYALSHLASLFHPQMLTLQAAAYESWHTTALQRASVIICDFVMFSCAWVLGGRLAAMSPTRTPTLSEASSRSIQSSSFDRATFIALVTLHAGPIIVDSMHFQYTAPLFPPHSSLLSTLRHTVKSRAFSCTAQIQQHHQWHSLPDRQKPAQQPTHPRDIPVLSMRLLQAHQRLRRICSRSPRPAAVHFAPSRRLMHRLSRRLRPRSHPCPIRHILPLPLPRLHAGAPLFNTVQRFVSSLHV